MALEPYNPRFYDAYFTGVEGEVDFYVEEAVDAGGPILELGCGTGRVLLPVARAGIEISGLDIDGRLLDLLREKITQGDPVVADRVDLFQADMTAFDLKRMYKAVIIPYRAFQHLLTPSDQRDALLCISRHLERGGRLVFNTYDPLADIARDGFSSPVRKDSDFIDGPTGHTLVAYFSRQLDPEVQIIEQEFVFEEFDSIGQSLGRWANLLQLRWTGAEEMRLLLAACGFQVEALDGDFLGADYVGYGELVWVTSKA